METRALSVSGSGHLPRQLGGEESTCIVGDTSLTPKLGRPLGEGNGNPLQHCCLENPMDRGDWRATVLGVTKGWTRLSAHTHLLGAKDADGPSVGSESAFTE